MIATLEGTLAHKDIDHVVVLVGGVGLEVFAPYTTIEKISAERVFLYTRLIVREDALTLYGFSSEAERGLFDVFIKISGIGPKLAVTMLGTLSVDSIRQAVMSEHPEMLTRVPGIGKKTAQKIIFELRDKFPAGLEAMSADEFSSLSADVMDALTALGYSVIEAQSAIQSIPADAPENVEERVLMALQHLGN